MDRRRKSIKRENSKLFDSLIVSTDRRNNFGEDSIFSKLQVYKKKQIKTVKLIRGVTYTKKINVILILTLIIMIVFNDKYDKLRPRFSSSKLKKKWFRQLDLESNSFKIDSLSKLNSHLYNVIFFVENIKDYLFSNESTESLKFNLRVQNQDGTGSETTIPLINDFRGKGDLKKLKLPFDLNKDNHFKSFCNEVTWFEFEINDILISKNGKSEKIGAYNSMTIRYSRYLWYFNVAANLDVKNNASERGGKINETHNFYFMNLLLEFLGVLTIISLVFDIALIVLLILQKRIKARYHIQLIIYPKYFKKLSLPIMPKISYLVWLLISLTRIVLTLSFVALFFFDKERTILSDNAFRNASITSIWVEIIFLLISNKQFKFIIKLVVLSFKNFFKAFAAFAYLALAFIVTGTILIDDSFYFYGFIDSARIFFSFLVGDSILVILDTAARHGLFILLFMITSIIYFIFVIQSLYISTVVGTFYDINDEEERNSLPEQENEKKFEIDLNFKQKDSYLTNLKIISRLHNEEALLMNLQQEGFFKLLDEQNELVRRQLKICKKLKELIGGGEKYNEKLFIFYMKFLYSIIESKIENIQVLKDSIADSSN